MLTCDVDEPALRPHELRLEAQLDRMEKMLADLCGGSMDLKKVVSWPRSVRSCMAPSPAPEHVAPASSVPARTPAMEMETKPEQTSEVPPATLAAPEDTSMCMWPTRTIRSKLPHSVSHARKFDRRKARFKNVDELRFWRCVHRIFPTEDPERTGHLADFVRSPLFDRFSFSAIILSVCFTIYKTDHIASTLSEETETWMTVGELMILGIFVSEMVMKMIVYGGYMFMSKDGGWNWFDLIIITFATVEMILEHVNSGALEVGFMRVIRLLRVLKVLRIFRAFRFLDELRLMVSCMLGSLTSLLWSGVLIMVVLLIAGLTFVQMVSQFQMDFPDKIAADTDLKNMINAHFSSVGLAMLGLFMSTTGGMDWMEVYDVVKQSGLTPAIAFVLYIVFFFFAFVNIVTSVFVDNARKNAEPDQVALLLQKRREDKHFLEELSGLIMQLDQESADANGMISWDDMQALHANDEIRDCLDMAGIDIADIDSFFFTVCKISGSESIDIDTFVHACFQMQGAASSVDMQTVLVQMHEIAMLLQRVSEHMIVQPKSGESAQSSRIPISGDTN